MAVKTITFRGNTYTHKYADILRPLTKAEREGLRQSIIDAKGIKYAVIVNRQRDVIDGWNRLEIAVELDIDCPMQAHIDPETEEELALSLNLDRRQISPEEAVELREKRIKRVVKARESGKSIRTIAEAEKVSPTQVQRDLETASVEEKSTVPGGTVPSTLLANGKVNPKSGKVTGRDGKKRPASVKKTDSADEPNELKDSIGEEVPPGLKGVFEKATDFRSIVNQLNEINRHLGELARHPAGACMRLQQEQIDLRNLKESVRFDMPFVVCPLCKGIAKTRKANCPCKQKGWLVEGAYKNLPKEYQK